MITPDARPYTRARRAWCRARHFCRFGRSCACGCPTFPCVDCKSARCYHCDPICETSCWEDQ